MCNSIEEYIDRVIMILEETLGDDWDFYIDQDFYFDPARIENAIVSGSDPQSYADMLISRC